MAGTVSSGSHLSCARVAQEGRRHPKALYQQLTEQIGGATGSIGDPSGRSTERSFLSPAELSHNVSSITKQVERFFERGQAYVTRKKVRSSSGTSPRLAEGTTGEAGQAGEVKVVNNLDWTKDISLIDFLRTVGKMARVNVMMARDRYVLLIPILHSSSLTWTTEPGPLVTLDTPTRTDLSSVKNRLASEQGISYTEFTYQLLQANDFLHLYRAHGCTIQMGGSDQWGNIVAGTDLIKRSTAKDTAAVAAQPVAESSSAVEPGAGRSVAAESQGEADESLAYGLTIPLLTTSTGEKFGKSAGNAVWLDESRTGVSDFYQVRLRRSRLTWSRLDLACHP